MRLSAYIIMFFAASLSATHAKHAESEHQQNTVATRPHNKFEQTMKLVNCVRGIFRIFKKSYTTASPCQVGYIGQLNSMMFPIY